MNKVKVIGAGLAGCEAAYKLAERGIEVELYEQKPNKKSPAHKSENFSELVCSNSLRADGLANAVGLLKEEMKMLGSLVMEAAEATRVPAGGAFAVDRDTFSLYITEKIKNHPLITVINEEVTEIDKDIPTIIATGPLTSDKLFEEIKELTTKDDLYFYDAAAPVVSYDCIDFSSAFIASRYGKGEGEGDYINCPMTEEEYRVFYNELINAKEAELKSFEDTVVFEGCMPVEVMAKRGFQTLLFGPLKPVGLTCPDGTKPFAVVQLRQENIEKTAYNIVGFQTHLTYGEQRRVFSLIPALKNIEILRYGVMHRNTYINSPEILNPDYSMRKYPNISFAGQINGVEGYVESAASGLMCGIYLARKLEGKEVITPDNQTAVGALGNYISSSYSGKFQPSNINFGLIEPLGIRIKNKQEKNTAISERAISKLQNMIDNDML